MANDECTLRVHDEPVAPYEDDDGSTRIGARRLVIRDDRGRELEVETMIWGQVGPEIVRAFGSDMLTCEGEVGPSDAIVQSAVLRAEEAYLVLVLKVDDIVVRGA